ncbi:expressed unknown protein [Seminavis robusta]|uniref:CRAL-TRIO domain-containing protein n=1 Tax=Seminavis robusta TaxID=568900 RepID=A0A9N8DHN1_9STRA|nr:expressed unknown protein [Seminavis robusta]|eukprot:Sro90_g047250.1 n/a (325) ;mRNA; r:20026-21092
MNNDDAPIDAAGPLLVPDRAQNGEDNGDVPHANQAEQQLVALLVAAQLVQVPPQIMWPLGAYSVIRLILTAQERRQALNIKQAVQNDANIEISVSDFWYAQLALVDGDDLEASLERVAKLQWFQQEYGGIEETVDCGVAVLREAMDMYPGLFLAFTFNNVTGSYALVIDFTKLHDKPGSKSRGRDGVLVVMKTLFFFFHAMQCDFESMRQGIALLLELDGFDWKKNFGSSLPRRIYSECTSMYPRRLRQCKIFHAGLFGNLLFSMMKGFTPSHVHSKFDHAISPFGRLDALYQSPSVEVANDELVQRFKDALQRRFANEAAFTL